MTAIPQALAARQGTTQQTNYIRKLVNYNDPFIAAPRDPFGVLPQLAFICRITVEIIALFNAGTTNVLTVGTTTGNANEIVAAADVNEGATGVTQNIATGLGRSLTAAGPTNLYVKYAQTGTAATAGQAIIIIEFVPNNDG